MNVYFAVLLSMCVKFVIRRHSLTHEFDCKADEEEIKEQKMLINPCAATDDSLSAVKMKILFL